MALSGMRGLSVFISDVRNCQNKEAERARVEKELANIRTRFKNEKVRLAFIHSLGCWVRSWGAAEPGAMQSLREVQQGQ
jgi:hypothetical protein